MTTAFTRLAVRVEVTGATTRLELGTDASAALAVLQSAVDGYVEAVSLDNGHDGRTLTAWCNDEGRLRAADINLAATYVASQAAQDDLRYPFVGAVVFTGGTDADGNTLGLTEPDAKRIEALADKYRVRP